MKRQMSRLVSLFLCLCMVLGGLPLSAMAAENDTVSGSIVVDGKEYSSIEEYAAETGQSMDDGLVIGGDSDASSEAPDGASEVTEDVPSKPAEDSVVSEPEGEAESASAEDENVSPDEEAVSDPEGEGEQAESSEADQDVAPGSIDGLSDTLKKANERANMATEEALHPFVPAMSYDEWCAENGIDDTEEEAKARLAARDAEWEAKAGEEPSPESEIMPLALGSATLISGDKSYSGGTKYVYGGIYELKNSNGSTYTTSTTKGSIQANSGYTTNIYCMPVNTSYAGGGKWTMQSNTDDRPALWVRGTVNLYICDGVEATFQGTGSAAGIQVDSGATLNIYACDTNGNVKTNGSRSGSGKIYAHGGSDSYTAGAGIGGAGNAVNGTIKIYSGTVYAYGGSNGYAGGAGIGTGGFALEPDETPSQRARRIYVYGGNVYAYGSRDVYQGAAGIGGGAGANAYQLYFGADGNTAYDPYVEAYPSPYTTLYNGAGIGGGYSGSADALYFYGGYVQGMNPEPLKDEDGDELTEATRSLRHVSMSAGAGIGGGGGKVKLDKTAVIGGNATNIYVQDGTTYGYGQYGSAGIGAGRYGNAETIYIGGTSYNTSYDPAVYAYSGYNAAAIGGGWGLVSHTTPNASSSDYSSEYRTGNARNIYIYGQSNVHVYTYQTLDYTSNSSDAYTTGIGAGRNGGVDNILIYGRGSANVQEDSNTYTPVNITFELQDYSLGVGARLGPYASNIRVQNANIYADCRHYYYEPFALFGLDYDSGRVLTTSVSYTQGGPRSNSPVNAFSLSMQNSVVTGYDSGHFAYADVDRSTLRNYGQYYVYQDVYLYNCRVDASDYDDDERGTISLGFAGGNSSYPSYGSVTISNCPKFNWTNSGITLTGNYHCGNVEITNCSKSVAIGGVLISGRMQSGYGNVTISSCPNFSATYSGVRVSTSEAAYRQNLTIRDCGTVYLSGYTAFGVSSGSSNANVYGLIQNVTNLYLYSSGYYTNTGSYRYNYEGNTTYWWYGGGVCVGLGYGVHDSDNCSFVLQNIGKIAPNGTSLYDATVLGIGSYAHDNDNFSLQLNNCGNGDSDSNGTVDGISVAATYGVGVGLGNRTYANKNAKIEFIGCGPVTVTTTNNVRTPYNSSDKATYEPGSVGVGAGFHAYNSDIDILFTSVGDVSVTSSGNRSTGIGLGHQSHDVDLYVNLPGTSAKDKTLSVSGGSDYGTGIGVGPCVGDDTSGSYSTKFVTNIQKWKSISASGGGTAIGMGYCASGDTDVITCSIPITNCGDITANGAVGLGAGYGSNKSALTLNVTSCGAVKQTSGCGLDWGYGFIGDFSQTTDSAHTTNITISNCGNIVGSGANNAGIAILGKGSTVNVANCGDITLNAYRIGIGTAYYGGGSILIDDCGNVTVVADAGDYDFDDEAVGIGIGHSSSGTATVTLQDCTSVTSKTVGGYYGNSSYYNYLGNSGHNAGGVGIGFGRDISSSSDVDVVIRRCGDVKGEYAYYYCGGAGVGWVSYATGGSDNNTVTIANCGNVTGVSSTQTSNVHAGTGIGSGVNCQNLRGSVIIQNNTGNVVGTSNAESGTGIGAGRYLYGSTSGACGKVIIQNNSGYVEGSATYGSYGVGIGMGRARQGSNGFQVDILNNTGDVKANGGSYGTGVGLGHESSGGWNVINIKTPASSKKPLKVNDGSGKYPYTGIGVGYSSSGGSLQLTIENVSNVVVDMGRTSSNTGQQTGIGMGYGSSGSSRTVNSKTPFITFKTIPNGINIKGCDESSVCIGTGAGSTVDMTSFPITFTDCGTITAVNGFDANYATAVSPSNHSNNRKDYAAAAIGTGYNCSGSGMQTNVTFNNTNVTAKSQYGAGIGYGSCQDNASTGGNLKIAFNGGTVTANGRFGAAVGMGYNNKNKSVDISFTNVALTAENKGYGAGIGGGLCNTGCTPKITVNGSNSKSLTVTGRDGGAGFGLGPLNEGCMMNIDISNLVNLTARGSASELSKFDIVGTAGSGMEYLDDFNKQKKFGAGAGIGGATGSVGGKITLTNISNLSATGAGNGLNVSAGIGGGTDGGVITLTNVKGTATGGFSDQSGGAGIGGGTGAGGTIKLVNCNGLKAYGKQGTLMGGAGIGGGAGGDGGTITISGGNVSAYGSTKGAGIGGGARGNGGAVTINNAATVYAQAGTDMSCAAVGQGSSVTGDDVGGSFNIANGCTFSGTAFRKNKAVSGDLTLGAPLFQGSLLNAVTSNSTFYVNPRSNSNGKAESVGNSKTVAMPSGANSFALTVNPSGDNTYNVHQQDSSSPVGYYLYSLLDGQENLAETTSNNQFHENLARVKFYMVSFNANSGSAVSPKQVRENDIVEMPTDPTRSGYLFAGWFTDSALTKAYDFSLPVKNDFTLYAKWLLDTGGSYRVETYKESIDGEYVISSVDYKQGTPNTTITITPEELDGFALNTSAPGYKVSGKLQASSILVLKVYYDRVEYEVTMLNTDLAPEDATIKAPYDSMIYLTPPSRDRFTFLYWTDERGNQLPNELIAIQNLGRYVTANWELTDGIGYVTEHYTQKLDGTYELFSKSDGAALAGETVTIETLPAASLPGYHVNEQLTADNGEATLGTGGKAVLRAYYDRDSYTVRLNLSGKTVSGFASELTGVYGEPVNLPQPSFPGYVFGGWYLGTPGSSTQATNSMTYDELGTELKALWTAETTTGYQVQHWQQTKDGTNYELVLAEDLQGATDQTVRATTRTYTGFTVNNSKSVLSGRNTVDGKLRLKVYYDRNTYTVKFNSNGGTAVSNKTARYGENIAAPTNPTKIGYTFDGWYKQASLGMKYDFADVKTPVTSNMTLYAKWAPLTNRPVVVKVYKQVPAGTYTESTYATYNDGVTGTTVTKTVEDIPGYTKVTASPTMMSGTVPTSGTLTLKQYFNLKSYTVTFNSNGGSSVANKSTLYTNTIAKPTDPTKTGFDFAGWYHDTGLSSAVDFSTYKMPASNVILYAKWTPRTYRVTFDYNSGAGSVTNKDVMFGTIYGSLPEARRDGYVFLGWKLGDSRVYSYSIVNRAENVTLVAEWRAVEDVKYVVEHYGENVEDDEFTLMERETLFGEVNTLAPYSFHTFEGFTKDEERLPASTSILGDGSLVIKLYYNRNRFDVNYTGNGAATTPEAVSDLKYNSTLALAAAPVRNGYTFTGWEFPEANIHTAGATVEVTDEADYQARWSANAFTKYVVQHYKQNVSGDEYTLVDTENLTAMTDKPVSAKWKDYDGFAPSTVKESIDAGVVKGDGSLVLKLYYDRLNYTVDFLSRGGTNVPEQSGIRYGGKAVKPTDPTRVGYDFDGWYTDSGCFLQYDFGRKLESDLTLYAKWTPKSYLVTFDYQGATGDNGTAAKTVTYGKVYGILPAPVKDGYIFNGWFLEDQQIVSGDEVAITANSTLTAHWISKDDTKYVIERYQQNIEDDRYTLVDRDVRAGTTDAEVTADIRSYVGFHEANSDRDVCTGTVKGDGSLVLKVYYDRDTFNVTYRDEPSSFERVDREVRYGTTATLPQIEDRSGYEFKGWDKNGSERYGAGTDVILTEASTFVTRYSPKQNVMYIVNHYAENVDDDGYTLKTFDVKSGVADTRGAGAPKSFEGFTENTTHPERLTSGNIAGDGSLVLSYYYDRDTFRVQFNSMGGSSVDTIPAAKYGAVLTEPLAPERTGYEFTGWYTDGACTTKYNWAQPVEADMILYAGWTPGQHTVTFEYDGADSGNRTATKEATYGTPYGELPAPGKTGYVFNGWVTSENVVVTSDTIVGTLADETLTARWVANEDTIYVVQHWRQDLNSGGYTLFETTLGLAGTTGETAIAEPKIYTGFEFDEENDGNKLSAPIKGDGSLVLKCYYNRKQYDVTFVNPYGTETVDVTDVKHGATVTMPSTVRQGYDFAGWRGVDRTLPIGASVQVTGDVTYEATWNARNDTEYTTKYYFEDMDGRYAINDEMTTVIEGVTDTGVTAIVPDVTGFHRKDVEGQLLEGNIEPDGSLVLKVYYERNTYELTLEKNGSGTETEEITAKYEHKFTNPGDMEKRGYTFTGWYADETYETEFDFEAPVTSDMTAYAGFTPNTYVITFNADGGTCDPATKEVTFDAAVGALPVPVKEGYVFAGWYDGDELVTLDTVYTHDDGSTVKALWQPGEGTKYTCEYWFGDGDGEYEMRESIECAGVTDSTVEIEAKEFVGYHENETWESRIIEGAIAPNGLLVLRRYYDRNQYQVRFAVGHDITLPNEDLLHGDMIETVPPEVYGYTFGGWYKTNEFEEQVSGTPIEGDMTVYAKWIAKEYQIKFDYTGATSGNELESKTVRFDESYGELPVPSKTGYNFAGWLNEADETVTAETVCVTEGDVQLHALWEGADGTEYKVQYWTETAEVGQYELYNEVVKYGVTDSEVTAEELVLDGFVFNVEHPENKTGATVASDGSTVLKVYYDRQVYTVEYTLDEGKFDEDVDTAKQVRYGCPIGELPTPRKGGYRFVGWTDEFDNEVTAETLTPLCEGTLVLKAVWKYTPPPAPPAPSIEYEYHEAYVSGYTDGTVRPDDNITREETAALLYRLSDVPVDATTTSFPDVSEDRWSYESICGAQALGIISGYSDGKFRPGQNITRAEFVSMMVRWADGMPKSSPMEFKDVPETHWAYEEIAMASSFGWIAGCGKDTFSPNAPITRAEAIAILNRAQGRVGPDKNQISEELLNRWPDLAFDKWYFRDVLEATVSHEFEIGSEPEVWKE